MRHGPMSEDPEFRSRVAGCFLGGALGDALGAPIEFSTWQRSARIMAMPESPALRLIVAGWG
jgi:ADP-ribosylglycohydrolase